MNLGSTYMILIGFLSILIIFIAIIFAQNEPDMIYTMMGVTGALAVAVTIGLVIRYNSYDPILNTELEITEQGLIRRGTDLLTIRFKFQEIGKISSRLNGTVLFRKGLTSIVQQVILDKRSFLNNFDVMFIPFAIDDYDKVIAHIRNKIA
jgi:hypothetical protein